MSVYRLLRTLIDATDAVDKVPSELLQHPKGFALIWFRDGGLLCHPSLRGDDIKSLRKIATVAD